MENYDLVVIGGGITGAGIFNLAARLGLKVLLLEKGDFASGTSSKSSKLVHGGLRYLKNGEFGMTLESVHERERLKKEAPGLVTNLGFALPIFSESKPGRYSMKLGLTIYDQMANKHSHRYVTGNEFYKYVPGLRQEYLKGGFLFEDAQVDDVRLVLRQIFEAEDLNPKSKALNYSEVITIDRNEDGWLRGITYRNKGNGQAHQVSCRAVINACGAWIQYIQDNESPKKKVVLRPLRGSHLVFPFWKVPVGQAISFFHAHDRRPIFLLPWQGCTLFGTTDVDHHDLNQPPQMSGNEKEYLLAALNYYFPQLAINDRDILASFSGIRPVISHGATKPSDESRESLIWASKGLVNVTGGKLTTFRKLAEKTLKNLSKHIQSAPKEAHELHHLGNTLCHQLQADGRSLPVFQTPECEEALGSRFVSSTKSQSLEGRYGTRCELISPYISQSYGRYVRGSHYLESELEFACHHEKVLHLDDLLLRRTRLGITSKQGGLKSISAMAPRLREALGWNKTKWDSEWERYANIWQLEYSPYRSFTSEMKGKNAIQDALKGL